MRPTWMAVGISLLTCSSIIISGMVYHRKELAEEESIYLDTIINYCSDAAVEDMIEYGDLGTDHVGFEIQGDKVGYIRVNPSIALETFLDMFLLNYNMSLSEENRETVMAQNLPVFAVAGYDGYYIAKQDFSDNLVNELQGYFKSNGKYATDVENLVKTKDGYTYSGTLVRTVGRENVLQFSPKLPYSYKSASNDLYCLTMGDNEALKVEQVKNVAGDIVSRRLIPWKQDIPGLGSKEERVTEINKKITGVIGATINDIDKNAPNWKHNFYIPGELTEFSGVNAITAPSVIALAQNVDYMTGQKANSVSVAGTRINTKRQVIGYRRDSKSLYTYVDKCPDGITKEATFENIEEAASRGYSCDWDYFN